MFLQVGAPCHATKLITDWIKDCAVEVFTDWLGNSLDLNPIENVWALMEMKLHNKDTSSLPELEVAIREIWGKMDRRWLHNLTD